MGFGLTHEEGLECSEPLGTSIGSLPLRYLGLPLKKGKTTRTDWDPIIEKVERRLEGWLAKLVSRAGGLVLLQSVLAAIPIFQQFMYKLPIGVGKRPKGLIRHFLWRDLDLTNVVGKHWHHGTMFVDMFKPGTWGSLTYIK